MPLPEVQEEGPEAPPLAPEDLEGEALPHVPALVPEDQSEVPLVEIGESDLEGVELPDWLEDLRAEIPVSAEEPVAEPVVAKPRMATAAAAQLEVTERQYAQAELLQRLVDYEQQEMAPSEGPAMRIPFVRWAISLVMLVAVLIPFSFERMGMRGYPLPASRATPAN